MMIATLPEKKAQVAANTATQSLPSDREIALRVDAIKAEWTIKERIERRYEALRRFDALLNSLSEVEKPAA